jgi:hypothetical protein
MIGLSWQEIRKSRSRFGIGRERVGCTQDWGGEDLGRGDIVVGFDMEGDRVIGIECLTMIEV